VAGLKGYVTNLDATAEFVIDAYHRLFQIEKSFRMSKHDLRARPIYHHHKRESIEAHLTVVFAALAVGRWIEDQTGWSIKKFIRTARRYRTVTIRVDAARSAPGRRVKTRSLTCPGRPVARWTVCREANSTPYDCWLRNCVPPPCAPMMRKYSGEWPCPTTRSRAPPEIVSGEPTARSFLRANTASATTFGAASSACPSGRPALTQTPSTMAPGRVSVPTSSPGTSSPSGPASWVGTTSRSRTPLTSPA
jgi:hypothetical protein